MVRKWFPLLAALALPACSDLPDYHYKMTVNVATPEGDRAYSSVRGIHSEYVSSIMSSSGQTIKDTLEGEAVIMDLPDGRTIFALVSRPDNPDYGTYVTGPALGPQITRASKAKGGMAILSGNFVDDIVSGRQHMLALKGAYDLPRTVSHNPSHRDDYKPTQMWPMFVTFDNSKDPTTVREVTPEAIGVKNITIEITKDDITTAVQERLPWLESQGRAHGTLRPNPPRYLSDTTPIQQVSAGDFSTELFK